MIRYTTIGFSKLPNADERRSSGNPHETYFLQNKSGTIEIEAIQSEIEIFEEDSGIEIVDDIINDDIMVDLIDFLNLHRILDVPV